jgi:2-keto-myo-inositol isomerase
MNISRRKALSAIALGTVAAGFPIRLRGRETINPANFRFCLNTSTISGNSSGLHRSIEVASQAGYDGIEIWVRDLEIAVNAGHSLPSIKRFAEDHGIRIENAIGFAPWMADGEKGFIQMEREMQMLAGIGCFRIAAPPAGVPADEPLDLFATGEKYKLLLDIGRRTGVMPQLEFWGSSPVLWHIGQALMISAVANDPDSRILPDVFHMFRGNSGFNTLKMVAGNMIDVFHMNDYPASKPRERQDDSDRVYPGDGVAPLDQIIHDLNKMGGIKVLSLELFNRGYWKEDPLAVAKRGLAKMKSLVMEVA